MSLQTNAHTPRTIFPNLQELVSKYGKPGQGLVVHLSNPIMRNNLCQRGRRMELELNVYGKSPDTGLEEPVIL
jgi:EWS/FLI1 activated transcript 2